MEIRRILLKVRLVVGLAAATLGLISFVPASALAGSSSNLIQVSKFRGVESIGDLEVVRGLDSTTLQDAVEVLGEPALLTKPYREVCNAYFGNGLLLYFVSYGFDTSCYERSLQSGRIRSGPWKVRVGQRLYQVGMPKRRVPRNARFFRGYGYELATFPFLGGRTGSVYASIGGRKRISSLGLFVGLAGN